MANGWHIALVSKKFWLAVLALIALPVLGEFNARLAVSRQLFEEEARLKHAIEIEQARSAFLQTYEQYVRSDTYVEWWARVSARMVKQDEVAVVPRMPASSVNLVAPAVRSDLSRDYAAEWWAAFFASVP
ncbi:MAG TPA: hypothetical protein VJG32_06175 [Anaerolineae bacterium]|nr:hypothetical protein [Anaerolineae bacterium]